MGKVGRVGRVDGSKNRYSLIGLLTTDRDKNRCPGPKEQLHRPSVRKEDRGSEDHWLADGFAFHGIVFLLTEHS